MNRIYLVYHALITMILFIYLYSNTKQYILVENYYFWKNDVEKIHWLFNYMFEVALETSQTFSTNH